VCIASMTSLPRERQARRGSSGHRLGRPSLLRPGCFISLGSFILGVSGVLIFFGPSSKPASAPPRRSQQSVLTQHSVLTQLALWSGPCHGARWTGGYRKRPCQRGDGR